MLMKNKKTSMIKMMIYIKMRNRINHKGNMLTRPIDFLGMKIKMQSTSLMLKISLMICRLILKRYLKSYFMKIILKMNFLFRNIQELPLWLMKVKLKFKLWFQKMIKKILINKTLKYKIFRNWKNIYSFPNSFKI